MIPKQFTSPLYIYKDPHEKTAFQDTQSVYDENIS